MRKFRKRQFVLATLMGAVPTVVFVGAILLLRGQDYRASLAGPRYRVVQKSADYELRDYDAHVMVKWEVAGNLLYAPYRGFDRLRDYFEGRNPGPAVDRTDPIPLTTPIFVQGDEPGAPAAERHWVGMFLPPNYKLATAPEVVDEKLVLEEKPAFRAAAITFSGWGEAGGMRANEAKLRAALERDGLKAIGPPFYARYDPPWTLPMYRRNEVLLPVQM